MAALIRIGCALALSLAAVAPASAHVAADPGVAVAGSYQAVRFRVGHGCADTGDTTALRIEIPAGIQSARPQPKPGWSLEIARGGDGKVAAVTWRGLLPADQFDEFALFFKLPADPQTLYFPTVQTCGADDAQWTEIPEAGEKPSHPAPALRLTAPNSADDAGHHH